MLRTVLCSSMLAIGLTISAASGGTGGGTTTTVAEAHYHCCLNGAYYTCPNADSTNECFEGVFEQCDRDFTKDDDC